MLMSFQKLAEVVGGELVGEDGTFNSVNTDTRSLKKGDLFVALIGGNFDAHDYLPVAERSGAVAAIVSREGLDENLSYIRVEDTTIALGLLGQYYRSQYHGQLAGITGSCGKTTVKGMLQTITEFCGPSVATKGNFNNHIGVPLTLLNVNDDYRYAVVEMGASALKDIAYLVDLAQPTVAVVTNVQPAHIGGFGSIENVAKEKGNIYSRLNPSDTAVINLDTAFSRDYLAQTNHCRQIPFTKNAQLAAEWQHAHRKDVLFGALNGVVDSGCSRIVLRWGGQQFELTLGVVGTHNLENALAAAACALGMGIKMEAVVHGLGCYTGFDGRMQVKAGYRQSTVIDDTYNANPASMFAAIDYLSSRKAPKFFIMGHMGELGERSKEYHSEVGRYAAEKGITRLFTIGDDTQYAAKSFGYGAKHYENKLVLVDEILPLLNGNTTVLVKGSRGAKMETVVNDICDLGVDAAC